MPASGSGLTNLRHTRALARKATDEWGYHFLLGSAQAWFERDSEDAQAYLRRHGLIDANRQPSGRGRQS